METANRRILERLRQDLMGPYEEQELLDSRPTDVYITGMLWPQDSSMDGEEDDRLEVSVSEVDSNEGDATFSEQVPISSSMRPSTAGISFAAGSGSGKVRLNIRVNFATYESEEIIRENQKKVSWKRKPFSAYLQDFIPPASGFGIVDLLEYGSPKGIILHIRSVPWKESLLLTVSLVNRILLPKETDKNTREKMTLFQTSLHISPGSGTTLIPRPRRQAVHDEDDRISDLLYREFLEYSTGHTCSSMWQTENNNGEVTLIRTEWIPETEVKGTDPQGNMIFASTKNNLPENPLSAYWITQTTDQELINGLSKIPYAYAQWITREEARIESLTQDWSDQARKNLTACRQALKRMEDSIRRLSSDRIMAKAFRLANLAMNIQYGWNQEKSGSSLEWRPFQMGFILLCLESLADRSHPDRMTMDLLWFPTGGGKTEAYLALVAFSAFLRRLKNQEDPDKGGGVAAIMRYTLRLLTTQQFVRATSMILACEAIRRGKFREFSSEYLGETPFSIGLWVGSGATPNDYDEARKSLESRDSEPSPRQLLNCPACHSPVEWKPNTSKRSIEAKCPNLECILHEQNKPLPVFTVDSDIYVEKPTFLIGTVDKFAQIVRKAETGPLFSMGTNPPDLIIQDELHLISGPLGTLAGLYEVALDKLLSNKEGPAKIIGSTATIRRASEQIRSIFNRSTCQFPPPGIDQSDSGFAITDQKSHGRLYAGVTTAGRSAKFTLQAVAASLLQSACSETNDVDRDSFWTLIGYFNSLRELGGALVLMQDDVMDSISSISKRRREQARNPENVSELTSRRGQKEIRDMLDLLKIRSGDPSALDIVLATNMLSVGVDIPRLGLMVMNGQPKTVAEYIQASSRVGRGKVPGLVVSVFNNGKVRDRSRFETFATWHSTLYRDIEVTSVTPFSSRARDKALHAALVAIVRHTIPGMETSPKIDKAYEPVIEEIRQYIVRRAGSIDLEERDVGQELTRLIRLWIQRSPYLQTYWNDFSPDGALLQSFEKAVREKALGKLPGSAWPTMNSLRNVEPECRFRLTEKLRQKNRGDDING